MPKIWGKRNAQQHTHPNKVWVCYPAGSYNYLDTRLSIHIGLSAGYPTDIVENQF